ncbi:MAG TPA: FHA domain-containing protein [Bdellovibrionales bacterium]|nr:FHA domain-containing protein [Bdellovibrionales bacterium]
MAKVTVKLRGEVVTRITLETGMEYVAGRAQDAQIPLAEERGISRHHLKFSEQNGAWVCQSLSKFVLIQVGTESHEVIELGESTIFTVPPYEFHFQMNEEATADGDGDGDVKRASENLPAFYKPQSGVPDDTSAGIGNNEATVAGSVKLVPYVRISHPNSADDEVLKLEGHLWSAGRDPNCEIPIESPHVSRKHFEIAQSKEGYFITDLGSSNGTKLNGHRLPPHEPIRIGSGDEIRVMNVVLQFEIRDVSFMNRMESLPVATFDPMLAVPAPAPVPWQPAVIRDPYLDDVENPFSKKKSWKQNKVRLALFALVPILVIAALLPDKGKKETNPRGPATSAGNSVVYENLTTEQKTSVKDAFNLSRNLYVQGKYELCLTELAKVHELLPQYENSKELQSFCEQGRELVSRQRDLDRKERERAMIEQQITGFVETCKAKLKVNSTIDETRNCLADAIELDPEHHLIKELISTAQMREEERHFMRKQRAATEKKAANGQAHYEKAKAVWKSGKLSKAIAAYEDFLKSNYPRIDDEKEQARRDLASIKKELKTIVDRFYEQCKALGEKSQWKEAYLACDKALAEDGSNEEARGYRGKMHSELKREMKSIYEDSVLEESLGNVDSAKEKWKKIVKENLDFDDYTKKAKSKLQKYGMDP